MRFFLTRIGYLVSAARLEGSLEDFITRMSPQRSIGQTKLSLWVAGILLAGSLAAFPLYRRCRQRVIAAKGYDPNRLRDTVLSGFLLFFLWAGVIRPLAWLPAAALLLVLTMLRAKPLGLGWSALLAVLQPWGMLDDLLHSRVFMLYQMAPGRQTGFPSGGESPMLDQQTLQRQITADHTQEK